jgi:hypothetical protein
MRGAIQFIIFTFIFLFPIGLTTAVPLETTISERYSIRTYAHQNIEPQKLIDLLNTASGYTASSRALPKIGDFYSIVVFAVNDSGSFLYKPETNSLSVWDKTVNKETISTLLTQDWKKIQI